MDRSVLSEIKRKMHENDPTHVVMRYRHLRNGTVFLPIERSGKEFYYHDKQGRLQKSRRWQKGKELFIKANNAVARSAHRDADGIFALNDWCIVRR